MANNSEVCHAWAHNEDKRHNGHNLSHDYGLLNSYYTCIGQRAELDDKVLYLIDTNPYSTSTGTHQSLMRSAIPSTIDNVYVFNVPFSGIGRNAIIGRWSEYSDYTTLGLCMAIKAIEQCIAVKKSRKLDHGFSRYWFDEMVRLFDVTKATTVNKLLRMKLEDFNQITEHRIVQYISSKSDIARKHFRKFLRLMNDGADIPTVVDAINGKGTWEAYLKRTAGVRLADKNRRLKRFVYGLQEGNITQKDITEHTKAGDLMQWLLSEYRKSRVKDTARSEAFKKEARIRKAKWRLERYCGMNGWRTYGGWTPYFKHFSYNGTTVNFYERDRCLYFYQHRNLTDAEYQEFVACEDKQQWIRDKRQWMLEQLQDDKRKQDEMDEKCAQENALSQMEARRQSELALNMEHIAELKAQGDEGLRQLYHEGYNVKLPYGEDSVYDGGNVLLRFNPIRNVVETTKGIRLKIDECKRLWKIFQRWFNHSEQCEKGLEIKAIGSQYRVHSFNHNILTAGCHQIAWSEMSYIANQLNF